MKRSEKFIITASLACIDTETAAVIPWTKSALVKFVSLKVVVISDDSVMLAPEVVEISTDNWAHLKILVIGRPVPCQDQWSTHYCGVWTVHHGSSSRTGKLSPCVCLPHIDDQTWSIGAFTLILFKLPLVVQISSYYVSQFSLSTTGLSRLFTSKHQVFVADWHESQPW